MIIKKAIATIILLNFQAISSVQAFTDAEKEEILELFKYNSTRDMIQDLEEKVETEIRKVFEKKIEDKVADLEEKFENKVADLEEKFGNKVADLEKKFEDKVDGSSKFLENKIEDKVADLEKKFEKKIENLQEQITTLKKTSGLTITNHAKSIEELQEDVEGNTLLVTNVKTENSEQTKAISDLKISSVSMNKEVNEHAEFIEKLRKSSLCYQKYVEAFNKVSYISGKISVKLSYNSFNLADGIILTTKGNSGYDGQAVIIPIKGITKYKIDSWLQKTDMTIGWTEHTETNAGFRYMNSGTPNFDKSFGTYSNSGNYYGISGNGEKSWSNAEADPNFEFKTVGSSLVAINEGGKFTWKVGSHSRDFDASSYFSNELYPAFTLSTRSETSIKISEINFSGLQC